MHSLIPADTLKTCSFFCGENCKVSWFHDKRAIPSHFLIFFCQHSFCLDHHILKVLMYVNTFLNTNYFQIRAEERKAITVLFWHDSTSFAFWSLFKTPRLTSSVQFEPRDSLLLQDVDMLGATKTDHTSIGNKSLKSYGSSVSWTVYEIHYFVSE